jgi:hypothetical protein
MQDDVKACLGTLTLRQVYSLLHRRSIRHSFVFKGKLAATVHAEQQWSVGGFDAA